VAAMMLILMLCTRLRVLDEDVHERRLILVVVFLREARTYRAINAVKILLISGVY